MEVSVTHCETGGGAILLIKTDVNHVWQVSVEDSVTGMSCLTVSLNDEVVADHQADAQTPVPS